MAWSEDVVFAVLAEEGMVELGPGSGLEQVRAGSGPDDTKLLVCCL